MQHKRFCYSAGNRSGTAKCFRFRATCCEVGEITRKEDESSDKSVVTVRIKCEVKSGLASQAEIRAGGYMKVSQEISRIFTVKVRQDFIKFRLKASTQQ